MGLLGDKTTYGYCTVLTNEKYVPGVKALARSLREAGCLYELVVLVPNDKKDILLLNEDFKGLLGSAYNCYCLEASNICIEEDEEKKLSNQNMKHWKETFFKLQVTGLTEFKKIVMLDSDMLIQKNLDGLFDCPNLTAVVAGKTVHPEWTELNSGIMVIEPSIELHDGLVSAIPYAISKRAELGLSCGDQDVFHVFCDRWENREELHLDERYNAIFQDIRHICKRFKCKVSGLSVIHFIGPEKPWMLERVSCKKALSIIKRVGVEGFRVWCKYRHLSR